MTMNLTQALEHLKKNDRYTILIDADCYYINPNPKHDKLTLCEGCVLNCRKFKNRRPDIIEDTEKRIRKEKLEKLLS